jgi:hypothetical protein
MNDFIQGVVVTMEDLENASSLAFADSLGN